MSSIRLAYPVATTDINAPLMVMQGDFKDNLRTLSNIGYRAIELSLRDPHVLEDGDYYNILDEYGMNVAAISTAAIASQDGLRLLDPNPEKANEAFRRVKNAIKVAQKFSCPLLIGKFRGKTSGEDGTTYEDLKTIFTKIGRIAEDSGVKVLIEPQNAMNMNNLNTVDETLAFIATLGCKSLGIHPDTYHMDISEEDLIGALIRCKGHTSFIHVSDSERLLPGNGHINFNPVIDALKDIDFNGYISPEVKQIPDSERIAKDFFAKYSFIER